MRFEILGPMRVSVHDREVPVSAGRDRAVLGMLILRANRIVPRSDLIDAGWADSAPRDARGQLHGCVSRLRKRLAGLHTTDQIIITEPDGYRLRANSMSVDLLEFRSLVAEARTAAADGQQDKARERYRAALALWRGSTILAGIDSGPIRQAAAGLEEERTRAVEECIELEQALGGAGELISELTELVHEHPYRERLHAALMLALYRADRQADALAAYQRVRGTLVTELGQEPGPALRNLHQRVLTGDESLRPAAVEPPNEASGPHRVVRHLPRTIHDFTGREADLAWLADIARPADPYAPPVITIDGMPGVGKTSLAVRAAHVLQHSYPDGQLFIDLHGHSKQRPTDPAAALSTLLRQLGVPASHIAPELDERIAQWRAELATRRAIVVLDNAASTDQVSPLLPASSGCLVLVTSRRRLVDLDGSRPLSVGTLGPDDAVTLLERIAGTRITAEPVAAAEVAKRCGYLPLALRLAAARLAHRPRWRVRDLADRLASPQSPLAELAERDRAVTDAFGLSYAHLSPASQRLFRLLGVHPGDHFDAQVAAALAGIGLSDAQHLLDELVDGHLIDEQSIGRHRLHDLVKTFAIELGHAADLAAERHAAIERVLDYYVHAAAAACTNAYPDRRSSLQLGEPRRPDLLSNHFKWGKDWLEFERPDLTAAVHQAADHGHHRYVWQLAGAMWRFLYQRGYLDDLVDTHQLGLAAAEHADDPAAMATMHNYLASAFYQNGRCRDAIPHLRSALAQRRRSNDRLGEASIRRNLALVLGQAGLYREAINECELALAAAVRAGDRAALALALVSAGDLHLTVGRYAKALSYSRRGLALAREIGDDQSVANALGNIGRSRARLGEPVAALRLLNVALRARRIHDRWAEAEAHKELGMIYRSLGDLEKAMGHHQTALAVVTDTGFRHEEYSIYNELGFTLLASGDVAAALAMTQRALAGTTKIGHKQGQARALDGIATCLRGTDPESARQHWLRALELYEELDRPERHDVEHHLAALAVEPVG